MLSHLTLNIGALRHEFAHQCPGNSLLVTELSSMLNDPAIPNPQGYQCNEPPPSKQEVSIIQYFNCNGECLSLITAFEVLTILILSCTVLDKRLSLGTTTETNVLREKNSCRLKVTDLPFLVSQFKF